jgi:hypothetical protein
MRKLLGAALMLALWAPVVALGSIVVDFDDLIGQDEVPDGYGGVADWGTWWYYDWSQPPYNPHSPPCRVYNAGGDGIFSFGDDVVFEGAWFAGHGEHDGFGNVYFELYKDDLLVHTSGEVDSNATPQWLGSGYDGLVDKVQVRITQGNWGFFCMDDVTYVPEPASLTFLALGGLALLRRR